MALALVVLMAGQSEGRRCRAKGTSAQGELICRPSPFIEHLHTETRSEVRGQGNHLELNFQSLASASSCAGCCHVDGSSGAAQWILGTES